MENSDKGNKQLRDKLVFDNSKENTKQEAVLLSDKSDLFIGQNQIVEKVNILLDKAKSAKVPLPHMLFMGDEGMGKETLARMIAKKLNCKIKVCNGGEIENAGDLIGILTNLGEGDIFSIKDIEKSKKVVKDFLYPALNTFQIDFVIDKGPYAKQIKFNIKPFTCIATASKPDKLSPDFKNLFFSIYRFIPYSDEEITQIILNKAKVSQITIDEESLKFITQRANGIPSEGARLFDKVKQYAQLSDVKLITGDIIQECLKVSESEFKKETKDVDRNISEEVRLKVWRRDGGKCVICGSQEKLEFDHTIPVSKGGSNTERNVRLLCERCNRERRDHIGDE